MQGGCCNKGMSWHVYELLSVGCLWDRRYLSLLTPDGDERTFTWYPQYDVEVRDFLAEDMTEGTSERFAREQLLSNLPGFLIETEDVDN